MIVFNRSKKIRLVSSARGFSLLLIKRQVTVQLLLIVFLKTISRVNMKFQFGYQAAFRVANSSSVKVMRRGDTVTRHLSNMQ